MKKCVVFLTNEIYFNKMLDTLSQLLRNNYKDDICLVIGDDLLNSDKLYNTLLNGVIIKHFPNLKFSEAFLTKFYSINREQLWRDKIFQYHKFYVFDVFFKQWDFIFYIDSGANIFGDVNLIFNHVKQKKFLAHSDAYPTYEWKLKNQFDATDYTFSKINSKYNLTVDYPQTTIMLFDTSIIEENTLQNLINLTEEVKISITNDQGIIALYFTNIKNCWEQITLGNDDYWFYDFLLRENKKDKPHIILKRI